MARWFVDRSPRRGIPSVSLRRLLPDARFVGCNDWEVSGCTTDSRKLEPGQVYVAVRGPHFDGHAFVGQALERGAAGVVVERHCPEAGRLQVVVPDARSAHAALCHALAGDPSDQLRVVGVAGSRGKTATGLYLRSIFEAAGARFGSIGSTGWSDGAAARPPGAAPPDAEALAAMLGAMADRGCAGAVLEAATESLERRAVDGLTVDAAVVTTLAGPEGCDPDLEFDAIARRRRAVARLFKRIAPDGAAVVNADDPDAELMGAVNLQTRRVSYGLREPADVTAVVDRLDGEGTRLRLRGLDREAAVALRLPGPRHVMHALAAAALAWARNVPTRAIVEGLESVSRLPGQMEPVALGQDFEVRVDRARTAPELRQALATLRALVSGRLLAVVGSEGGAPRDARLGLARAAEEGADHVVLTGNNPRSEDPDRILDDVLAGFARPGRVQVEADRRRAIHAALGLARPGDAVLIAGKGRQSVQIFADRVVPFDDAEVAADWLRAHRTRRASA